jgi:hypothetical protein
VASKWRARRIINALSQPPTDARRASPAAGALLGQPRKFRAAPPQNDGTNTGRRPYHSPMRIRTPERVMTSLSVSPTSPPSAPAAAPAAARYLPRKPIRGSVSPHIEAPWIQTTGRRWGSATTAPQWAAGSSMPWIPQSAQGCRSAAGASICVRRQVVRAVRVVGAGLVACAHARGDVGRAHVAHYPRPWRLNIS